MSVFTLARAGPVVVFSLSFAVSIYKNRLEINILA